MIGDKVKILDKKGKETGFIGVVESYVDFGKQKQVRVKYNAWDVDGNKKVLRGWFLEIDEGTVKWL